MVFKLDGSVLTMTRIGNHEDVRRFIKGTAQVADELGTARRTLERRFQTETGKTLHEFLTEIRLRRANRTLRQLDTPLGEIARESGYSALSAFIRMFKQSTGLHPRDYRRAHVKR
jgi:LacI family transcriptional regulator